MSAESQTDPFVLKVVVQSNCTDPSQPLASLRLAVKDLFHIKGMPTTAGNPDWARSHPVATHTSSVVSSLMEKGASLVGKTLTDELAYSLNGQNAHYGTPRNPVAPDRLPGGSSSGSATAVSGKLADIGLGTDTGGSIRVPASYNGLYGLRPSHGRISCDHMVALAPSFDTVGWMTRDLASLIQVAQVLFHQNLPDFQPPRLGVLNSLVDKAEHRTLIHQWLADPAVTNGCQKSEMLDWHWDTPAPGDIFRVLQGAEIWQQHGEWITQTQPSFAADIEARLKWCEAISPSEVNQAKADQQQFLAQLDSVFTQADVLVLPTTPGPAPKLNEAPSNLAEYRNRLLNFTALAGLAGLPQLHLPLFSWQGAPCGLSLLGRKGSDLALLSLAKHIVEYPS